MSDRLVGKCALVVGAGPNIGGTIAHFLAREGARVAVVDRDGAAAAETVGFLTSRGFEALAVTGDALVEADVERAVAETVARFGRLDVLVNSAGKVAFRPILELELSEWLEYLTSYPTAGMLTTKYAAGAMIAQGGGGSIIHLLSTAAHFGQAAAAAYGSAKAALLNFSRCAAMDFAHDGIRVNTISPCAMEHNLWTARSAEIFDPNFVRPQTRAYRSRDDYLKSIPLERFPRAADLAWVAVYLASDESAFLTGVDIPVDGGLRWKYPAWRPGDHTGLDVMEYAHQIRRTEYGEETTPLFESDPGGFR